MKTLYRLSMILVLLLSISALNAMTIPPLTGEEEVMDTVNYNTYYGKVIDAESKEVLPFATIEVEGLNIATVTNIDGDFILKVPKDKPVKQVKISYVGYKNLAVPIDEFTNIKSKQTVKLEPTSINLEAVTIRPENARSLITAILENIEKNYKNNPMMMTAFYRETVKKNRNYVSIVEAVVDIFKSGYVNDFQFDNVKLLQGRKSADVEEMDTVLFKVQGGPVTTLLLDIMKNPYILLTEEYEKIYEFKITDVISINDRLHYVISFNQLPYVTSPFYYGKFYVDMNQLAITEAEFALSTENEIEVANMFIRKKPIGMSVIPEKAVYHTKYTIQENTWYFSYARAEVKFKVDWDKKLFNTTYLTMSEIAITDRGNEPAERIPGKERFKRSQVLNELVYVFFDQDFWGSYNVIEPDQTIENAIKRLNRKYTKTNKDLARN